jgi:hypothetical protein
MYGTAKYLTYKLKAGRICAEGKENSEKKLSWRKYYRKCYEKKPQN